MNKTGLQNLTYLLFGPLQKKFADPGIKEGTLGRKT